ncbi:MAG: hypothetical protein ACLSUW_04850 [Akkermansia sp.]
MKITNRHLVGEHGDCYDRFTVRIEEMRSPCASSAKSLKPCRTAHQHGGRKGTLPEKKSPDGHGIPDSPVHDDDHGGERPCGRVYFAAENPKGELFLPDSREGFPTACVRSPSFCNLSILPELMKGHLVSDVPAILSSFDFVMGECDR